MPELVEFKGTKISQYEADILKDLEAQTGYEFSLIGIGFNRMSFEVKDNCVIGIKMWSCGFIDFPEILRKLKSLQILDLSFNNFSSFPELITDFTSLIGLGLNKTEIEKIPETIGNLKSLKELFLSVNKLSTLPESIGDLKSLQVLNLGYNQLTSLPESIGNIASLSYLYLSNNKLTFLPESIGNLKSLIVLSLEENSLIKLPESISHLESLKTLNLKNNKLKKLPDTILELEKKGVTIYEDLRKIEIKMMKCKICGEEFPALTADGKCRLCVEKEQGFVTIQMISQDQLSPRVVGYSEPNARQNLLNPDEIIIKEEHIKIEFTYPLSNAVIFNYGNKGGFSRMNLWNCIYDGYKRIYEEEKEVGDPGTAPNLLNRARSYGKYGVWGHQIGELYIERVLYNKSRNTISLRIGS